MKISTKEITDECQHCGDILVCQLCREGHGINRERINVTPNGYMPDRTQEQEVI